MEVVYVTETTEQRMFNGKMTTLTVKANRPSQEALGRYGEAIIRMVQELEAEDKKRAGN